ncbi:hypothetical protein CRE_22833 [Caenorhabditis remanei]|uniref:Uncharacterized protein n=1 Tax=Caenorhabditis remanei TaxID=31234 RepID=E3MHG8_CAERE|nr:hypothetical protein CRE_22833 [Caenorhabditis remanei]
MSALVKQEILEDVSSSENYKKWSVKQEPVEEASEVPESQPDSKKGLSIVSNQKSNKNTAPRQQTSVLMSLLLGDDDNIPLPYKSKKKEPKFKAPRVKNEPRAPRKPRSPRNPRPSDTNNASLMRFHQQEYLKNVYWQEYCRYMDTNWHSNYDVMRRYYGMPPVVIPETAHPSWRQSISPMTRYCSGYSSDSSSSF